LVVLDEYIEVPVLLVPTGGTWHICRTIRNHSRSARPPHIVAAPTDGIADAVAMLPGRPELELNSDHNRGAASRTLSQNVCDNVIGAHQKRSRV
jgi:hypothetical protein